MKKILVPTDFSKAADYALEAAASIAKKAKAKRLEPKYNTFLVFHSGKIIMSGINSKYMRSAYYSFVKLMRENRDIIEEKLNTQKLDLSIFSTRTSRLKPHTTF